MTDRVKPRSNRSRNGVNEVNVPNGNAQAKQESGNEYGLRKRATGHGRPSDPNSMKHYKLDNAAKTKMLEQAGIHGLSKIEVKSDLQLIRDSQSSILESVMEDKKMKDYRVLATRSMKSNNLGENDTNFKVPFEGLLNSRHEAEEDFAVHERDYHSVRHAYIERIHAINDKKKEFRKVLDQFSNIVKSNTRELEKVDENLSILNQAIVAIQRLKKENEMMKQKLNLNGQTETKVESKMKEEEDSEEEPYYIDETIQNLREELGSKVFNTSYGRATVIKVRVDGMVVVNLGYGIGVLNANTLVPIIDDPSLDLINESKIKTSQKCLTPLPISSAQTVGAPRGVRLELNNVSLEPDFALRPFRIMDPEKLDQTLFSDCNLKTKKANDQVPASWGGPWSLPWSTPGETPTIFKERLVLSRDELATWEQERLVAMKHRSEYLRLHGKVNRMRHSLKRKDKILIENSRMQETLVHRLVVARTELSSLRSRCAQLIRKNSGGTKSRVTNGRNNQSKSRSAKYKEEKRANKGKATNKRKRAATLDGSEIGSQEEDDDVDETKDSDNENVTRKRQSQKATAKQQPKTKRSRRRRSLDDLQTDDLPTIGQTRTGREWR